MTSSILFQQVKFVDYSEVLDKLTFLLTLLTLLAISLKYLIYKFNLISNRPYTTTNIKHEYIYTHINLQTIDFSFEAKILLADSKSLSTLERPFQASHLYRQKISF